MLSFKDFLISETQNKPYKVGTKVTVDGVPGEINFVSAAKDENDVHRYKITDLSVDDPYKQKRLENGNFINHDRIKVVTEGEVIHANFGKKKEEPKKEDPKFAKAQKLSLGDVFGTSCYSIIRGLGYKFSEKPESFTELKNEYAISKDDFAKIEKELAKKGYTLITYNASDVFERKSLTDEGADDRKTLGDIARDFHDDTFIVKFPSGNRYLCDKTGANTYIRMWMYIKK